MRRIAVLLIDLGIIYASIILSFLLLKNAILLNFGMNIGAFYYVSPFIAPIYIVIAYVFRLIGHQRRSANEIAYTVFIVATALTISIMAAIFFIREGATSYPRSVILLSYGFYFLFLTLWRVGLQRYLMLGHGRRDVLVVGTNTDGLVRRLKSKYSDLYTVKYVCPPDSEFLFERAADASDVFVLEDASHEMREALFRFSLQHRNKNIYFVPKLSDIAIMHARMQRFDDIPVYLFSRMFLTDEERFVKRTMDVAISLALLVASSPLFVLFAFLIKLDGGSVFYKQERLTRDRKRFNIIKFRTMIPEAESGSGPMLSELVDRRVTRIGRFLRNTRLDELPQFWNILKGEMSIVGPRPERPYFVEKIEKEIPEFRYRLNVKAGLTGMAQLMGKYNTDARQKLHYDLHYINNFSIFRDILLMLQTINVIFWKESGEGVPGPASNGDVAGQPVNLKIESNNVAGYPSPAE